MSEKEPIDEIREDALLAKANGADKFVKKMEAFITQSTEHQNQTGRSFSKMGGALQRQEQRLQDIAEASDETRKDVKGILRDGCPRGETNEARLDGHERELQAIKKQDNPGATSDDINPNNVGIDLGPVKLRGKVQDIVRLLIVFILAWILLKHYGIDPPTLIAKLLQ